MKMKFIAISIAFATIISCNQENKKDELNSEETTFIKQGVLPEANNTPKNDSGVYFVNLIDGEKVHSPLFIEMGVKGMEVEPAGKIDEGKGHHHIIVDGSYVEKGQMVPKDETHLHFGKGQTSDTLKLSLGKHMLTLQFANGVHQSYGKDWSKTIMVEVEK
jgi:hypothetical protein